MAAHGLLGPAAVAGANGGDQVGHDSQRRAADRVMRSRHRARAPQQVGEGVEQDPQRGAPRRVRHGSMQLGVGSRERLGVVARCAHARKAVLDDRHVALVAPLGGKPSGVGLELQTHVEQVVAIERSEIGAGSLASLDDAEVEQPAHPLAQARACDPQLGGELALRRQPLAGRHPALGEERLQPVGDGAAGGHRRHYIGPTYLVRPILEAVRMQSREAEPEAPSKSTVARPGKIVAIGLNYRDHVRETGRELPERPLVFAKFPTSVIGDGDAIEIDRTITERVDWEGELAVIVGRAMRKVHADEALSHVLGYTVANDVSARDLQRGDGQWVRAKSLDTFCPLGPVVVPAAEIGDPQTLGLRTRVNGETVQDSSTAEMVFSVAELLAFCSHCFTLEPGDVVLTGTPWGCGELMNPARSLQDGDVVEVEIDRIGTLRNPVREIS